MAQVFIDPKLVQSDRKHNRPPVVFGKISGDLMEAIYLGDPGHFLLLSSGIRYYLWRKVVLRRLGKTIHDRIYPKIPPFEFSLTNTLYSITSEERRATYGYLYDCWFITVFGDDPAGEQWQQFFQSEVYSGMTKADVSVVIRNMTYHFSMASTLFSNKIGRDDAIAYLEASFEFWPKADPELPPPLKISRGYDRGKVYSYVLGNGHGVGGQQNVSSSPGPGEEEKKTLPLLQPKGHSRSFECKQLSLAMDKVMSPEEEAELIAFFDLDAASKESLQVPENDSKGVSSIMQDVE